MQTLTSPVMVMDWRHALINNREKALTQLYAQTYPMVLHYVKQHQGSSGDAQDLLQEAIILFYEKTVQEQLDLTAAASTYVMGICKNKWRQELEKRRRNQNQLLQQGNTLWEEPSYGPETPVRNLLQYVAELGKKCQDILIGFYYLGQSMPRIAAQHQYRNVHTATVQKFKCLERLRKSVAAFNINDFR